MIYAESDSVNSSYQSVQYGELDIAIMGMNACARGRSNNLSMEAKTSAVFLTLSLSLNNWLTGNFLLKSGSKFVYGYLHDLPL